MKVEMDKRFDPKSYEAKWQAWWAEQGFFVCEAPSEKANNLYRAAILWQDKVSDVARARQALEAVSAIDPSYGDVFQRLQAIYIAEGARAELAELLKRRLDAVTDPAERVEMEVLRGRALADVGDSSAAPRETTSGHGFVNRC